MFFIATQCNVWWELKIIKIEFSESLRWRWLVSDEILIYHCLIATLSMHVMPLFFFSIPIWMQELRSDWLPRTWLHTASVKMFPIALKIAKFDVKVCKMCPVRMECKMHEITVNSAVSTKCVRKSHRFGLIMCDLYTRWYMRDETVAYYSLQHNAFIAITKQTDWKMHLLIKNN